MHEQGIVKRRSCPQRAVYTDNWSSHSPPMPQPKMNCAKAKQMTQPCSKHRQIHLLQATWHPCYTTI